MQNAIDRTGEGFLRRHDVTFVNNNRNRTVRQMLGKNFRNRGNTCCSRQVLHVGSNSTKFERSRKRRKSRKLGTLLKRMNRVMSLQNLLKSSRFPQESKSLFRITAPPTKEEMLIKVYQLAFAMNHISPIFRSARTSWNTSVR